MPGEIEVLPVPEGSIIVTRGIELDRATIEAKIGHGLFLLVAIDAPVPSGPVREQSWDEVIAARGPTAPWSGRTPGGPVAVARSAVRVIGKAAPS